METRIKSIGMTMLAFEEVIEYIKRLQMRIEKLEKDKKEMKDFIMRTVGKEWAD